ncbi:MAG TPA: chlorite dismutase family protein [Acidimicrobiales bacterium]|nr:chlorite dismutase family protein [Acidimicrobiales bacterium]
MNRTGVELTGAELSLGPGTGVGVLHLFCRAGGAIDIAAVLDAETVARKAGDQVVAASILGHKADVALMVLGPDLWRLRRFQTAVAAAGLDIASSYVSLTEVSEYAARLPDELKQSRLYPQLPPEGKPAFCFYPMSKRRGDAHNWYTLDYDQRLALMVGHGRVGRTFHGRVLQLVTGSTGLDDFEWGVTLFAVHPGDLKECVYQMRFDEASARYAEFGPFYSGMVADLETVLTSAGR